MTVAKMSVYKRMKLACCFDCGRSERDCSCMSGSVHSNLDTLQRAYPLSSVSIHDCATTLRACKLHRPHMLLHVRAVCVCVCVFNVALLSSLLFFIMHRWCCRCRRGFRVTPNLLPTHSSDWLVSMEKHTSGLCIYLFFTFELTNTFNNGVEMGKGIHVLVHPCGVGECCESVSWLAGVSMLHQSSSCGSIDVCCGFLLNQVRYVCALKCFFTSVYIYIGVTVDYMDLKRLFMETMNSVFELLIFCSM